MIVKARALLCEASPKLERSAVSPYDKSSSRRASSKEQVNDVTRIMAVILTALVIAAAAGANADELTAPCAACHGAQGQSQFRNIPSLGGQPAPFLAAQLSLFREGKRRNPDMDGIMPGFSDDEIGRLADAFSQMPPPSVPGITGSRFQRGRKIAATLHCGSCHGDTFAGENQVPRLAGQREDYLLTTLKAFKSGARTITRAGMRKAMNRLRQSDMRDLVYFLANLH